MVLWLVSAAWGWDHNGVVLVEPTVIEVTSEDVPFFDPGILFDLSSEVLADWIDDPCLMDLDVAVEEVDPTDLRGPHEILLDPDLEIGTLARLSLIPGRDVVFDRYGESYVQVGAWTLSIQPDGFTFTTTDFLGLIVASNIGHLLGLDRPPDVSVDSVFNQGSPEPYEIRPRDREQLRALYGSGLEADCGADAQIAGLPPLEVTLPDDCGITTFGAPLLDSWVRTLDLGAEVLTNVGVHPLEICGSFDVAAGCSVSEFCTPIAATAAVCEDNLSMNVFVGDDGVVEADDVTLVVAAGCVAGRTWTLSRGDEVLDTIEPPGLGNAASFSLDAAGTYTVTLTHIVGDRSTSITEEITWADAPEGCGCSHRGNALALAPLLILVAGARRRRSDGTDAGAAQT